MTSLVPGAPAPLFTLARDDGTQFDLEAQRGRYVVLFFYPKDDTQGCTVENCDFSDLLPEFAALGVSVLGISPDSIADHLKFRAKYGLKAPLAADPERVAITAYDVWGEKRMAGNTYMGLKRTTFIVAPDGTLAEIIPVARVKDHAAKVLDRIRALIAET